MHSDGYRDMPDIWKPNPIWLSSTCAKREIYHHRWGKHRIFYSRQIKDINIYSINIHYPERILTNMVFSHRDSQMCVVRLCSLLYMCYE